MDTRLERLLETIDPRHASDETNRRVHAALSALTSDPEDAKSWWSFRDLLCQLLVLIDVQVLRLTGAHLAHPDLTWSRCVVYLRKLYGQVSGEKAAFEMARSGSEGGLVDVLHKFAWQVAESYVENELRARISSWWNDLSVEGKLAAGEEYLAKYGDRLPWELTEGSAARVRENLPEVLLIHHRLLQQTRRIGRS